MKIKLKQLIITGLLLPAFSMNAYEVPTHMSMSDVAVTQYFQPKFDYNQVGVGLITIGESMDFRG